MARKSIAIIDVTGPQQTPLDAIPDDLKKFVEEVYARQQKTPGRERVTYDSDQERDAEFKLMADYVAQRPKGVLGIRRSPSKDLPPHTMDIRINADLVKNAEKNVNGEKGQVKR